MLKPLSPRPARGTGAARAAALFAIVVTFEAVVARRFDLIETETLYAALLAASLIAVIGLLAVMIALWDVWRDGAPGFGAALVGLGLALVALAPFGAGAVASVVYPPIYDVATDPAAGLAFRSRPPPPAPFLPGTADPDTFAVLQEEAYPDIAPRIVPLSTVEAHAAAHLAIQELGWTIAHEVEPADEGETGALEAEGRSLLLGIPDDILIRISPFEGGARLDVRAASRFPVPDLGENARRIRAFLERFDEIKGRSVAG